MTDYNILPGKVMKYSRGMLFFSGMPILYGIIAIDCSNLSISGEHMLQMSLIRTEE